MGLRMAVTMVCMKRAFAWSSKTVSLLNKVYLILQSVNNFFSQLFFSPSSDDVQFCGYTVPHPAESKMLFRIQSHGTPALEILKRGLKDLEKLCDHTIKLFDKNVREFNKTWTFVFFLNHINDINGSYVKAYKFISIRVGYFTTNLIIVKNLKLLVTLWIFGSIPRDFSGILAYFFKLLLDDLVCNIHDKETWLCNIDKYFFKGYSHSCYHFHVTLINEIRN